jgi:Predicted integral membrane protein
MELRGRNVLGTVIVAASALAGLSLVGGLPEQIAIHFGPAGQPDGYVGRTIAVVVLPAVQALLVGVFAVLPRIDPLGENIEKFGHAYDVLALSTVGFVGYSHVVVLLWNAGYAFSVAQALAPAVAVLYYTVGAVLERAEQNWFVGIRNPWTLSDEQVWEDTHVIGGSLFKLISVPALVGAVLPRYTVALIAVPAVVVAVGTAAYSYWDYQRLTQAP